MKINKHLLFIILIACFLVQWFVPLKSMVNYLYAKSAGESFLFRVAPLDPYDPFKGRYVLLRMIDLDLDCINPGDDAVYAVVENQGKYAQIVSKSTKKPASSNYIKATTRHSKLILPFDRYYLNEKIAPRVEDAMNKKEGEFHIKVHIKDGDAVITGLYIFDIPVEEYFNY